MADSSADIINRLKATRSTFNKPNFRITPFGGKSIFNNDTDSEDSVDSNVVDVDYEIIENSIDEIEESAKMLDNSIIVPVESEILVPSSELVSKAQALTKAIGTTYLELAKICKTMIVEGVPAEMGYEDNKVFFNEVIGLDARKAYYFVSIAGWIADNNVDEGKITNIGWSKVKELVRAPKESIDELVKLASEVSTDKLKKAIKEAKADPNADEKPKANHPLNLKFFDDQIEDVENSIMIARNVYKTDSAHYAVWRMMRDWAINQDGSPDRDTLFRYVESNYDVKVVPNE